MRGLSRLISFAFVVLSLAACKSGGGGGAAVLPVGNKVDGNSSALAQTLSGKVWCSQASFTEQGDVDQTGQAPIKEVMTFKSDGNFSWAMQNQTTGSVAENTEGKWGASETSLTMSAENQTLSFPASVDKNNVLTLTSPEDGKVTYTPCGTAPGMTGVSDGGGGSIGSIGVGGNTSDLAQGISGKSFCADSASSVPGAMPTEEVMTFNADGSFAWSLKDKASGTLYDTQAGQWTATGGAILLDGNPFPASLNATQNVLTVDTPEDGTVNFSLCN